MAPSNMFFRCRFGECVWDATRSNKLKYMLECAVQRRFPKGFRVLVQTYNKSCLGDLFTDMSKTGFCITRYDMSDVS